MDGKLVQNAKDGTQQRFSTFGTHQFNKGIHEWKFKIHELNGDNKHWLYFGIATQTKYEYEDHNDDEIDYHSYAFGVSGYVDDTGV